MAFLPWLVHGLRITNFRGGIRIDAMSVVNEWTPTRASICLSIYIIRGIYRCLLWIVPSISYPTNSNLSNAHVGVWFKYLQRFYFCFFLRRTADCDLVFAGIFVLMSMRSLFDYAASYSRPTEHYIKVDLIIFFRSSIFASFRVTFVKFAFISMLSTCKYTILNCSRAFHILL